MKLEELYEIGFQNEIEEKYNGILEYYIIQEEDNDVYLQISLSAGYPTLVTNQYDWSEMDDNETHLPMVNVNDIETLKREIETLKRLFIK